MELLAALIFGTTLYYEKPVVLEPTRDTLITHQMELLAACESSNREYIINWDDGGSPSFGLYQIKIQTARWWNEKYELGFHIDEESIMQHTVQHKLTYTALKNGMAHHWSCAYKTGIL